MDPNETLRMIRYWLTLMGEPTGDASWYKDNATYIDNVLELWHSLDEWLSEGGFKPRDWDTSKL